MADFQQRHYQALATLLQRAEPVGNGREDTGRKAHHEFLRNALADMLANDNPKFNRPLFIAACEPGAKVTARTAEGARKR